VYGHITTWETGGVTDMGCLFVAKSDDSCDHVYNSGAKSFNDNITTSTATATIGLDRAVRDRGVAPGHSLLEIFLTTFYADRVAHVFLARVPG